MLEMSINTARPTKEAAQADLSSLFVSRQFSNGGEFSAAGVVRKATSKTDSSDEFSKMFEERFSANRQDLPSRFERRADFNKERSFVNGNEGRNNEASKPVNIKRAEASMEHSNEDRIKDKFKDEPSRQEKLEAAAEEKLHETSELGEEADIPEDNSGARELDELHTLLRFILSAIKENRYNVHMVGSDLVKAEGSGAKLTVADHSNMKNLLSKPEIYELISELIGLSSAAKETSSDASKVLEKSGVKLMTIESLLQSLGLEEAAIAIFSEQGKNGIYEKFLSKMLAIAEKLQRKIASRINDGSEQNLKDAVLPAAGELSQTIEKGEGKTVITEGKSSEEKAASFNNRSDFLSAAEAGKGGANSNSTGNRDENSLLKGGDTNVIKSGGLGIGLTDALGAELSRAGGMHQGGTTIAEGSKAKAAPALVLTSDTAMETAIISQVSERLNKMASEGKHELLLQLKPENLGKLSLKIVEENGMIYARFHTETESARSTLESNLHLLKETLEKSGLSVQQLSVSVGQGDGKSRSGDSEPSLRFGGNRYSFLSNSAAEDSGSLASGGIALLSMRIRDYIYGPDSTISFKA